MGNLPCNVRCLVEVFNTSILNGNTKNNSTCLHVLVPRGKQKAAGTQWNVRQAVGAPWPQGTRLASAFSYARLAGLCGKNPRFSILMLCSAVTKQNIHVQLDKHSPSNNLHLLKPDHSEGGQWAPAPGLINWKCRMLAVCPSFLSLMGPLCSKD